MIALEFDEYALIWWEQLLSDRENDGQGDVFLLNDEANLYIRTGFKIGIF